MEAVRIRGGEGESGGEMPWRWYTEGTEKGVVSLRETERLQWASGLRGKEANFII